MRCQIVSSRGIGGRPQWFPAATISRWPCPRGLAPRCQGRGPAV